MQTSFNIITSNISPKNMFKLSRTKIDDFIKCPRCFYLNVKLGITRPSWPAFSLNNAVDNLFKKEFDIYRANGVAHPLMKHYKIDAIPFAHKEIEKWRNFREGISFYHKESNMIIYGAIDDLWIDNKGKLIIVDYKATSIQGEVALEGEYKEVYKRQAEVYQWLFRKNGFSVSEIAYFVYANALKDKNAFDGKLEFDVRILPYKGDDSWVEPTIIKIKKCLERGEIPSLNPNCEYCLYRQKASRKESFLK